MTDALRQKARALSLSDTLTFGKHKGLTVQQVVDKDPRYLAWACQNVSWFDLDVEARRAGQRAINAADERQAGYLEAWAWGVLPHQRNNWEDENGNDLITNDEMRSDA